MTTPAVTPTILVVDDDQGLLILLEETLRSEAYNVATISSGAEALVWLRKNFPDLLLLDLKLRDFDGRAFIDAMARLDRAVPFIIITGQGDERVAVEMMKQGALDYLVKDVNFIEFVPTMVRRAFVRLAEKRKLAEAEAALRAREAELHSFVRHAPAAIAMFDRNMRCLAASSRWTKEYGRGHENLVGLSHYEIHPDLPERWRDIHRKGLAGEFQSCDDDLWEQADGRHRWLQWAVNPWLDVHGTVGGILIAAEDTTERKRLQREIAEIGERERRQFGQELHDGLGQQLTGLEMLSHALAQDLKGAGPVLAKRSLRLNQALRETVTQARIIAHGLSPVPAEADGLMRALAQLAADTNGLPGVTCRFICKQPVELSDLTTATNLYRIAQEAVNNALKHGRATRIGLRLKDSAGTRVLSIRNNGRSLPKRKTGTDGMGLNVMRHRAEMIGATLELKSDQRQGVQVVCTLPPRS